MKYTVFAFMLLVLVIFTSAVAQAPPYDATVSANGAPDSQVSNSYGLKVQSTTDKARIIVLKNAIWGIDDQNRVKFQLFTDGTLHLFDDNYQQTIVLDGLNGQIWVRGQRVAVQATP